MSVTLMMEMVDEALYFISTDKYQEMARGFVGHPGAIEQIRTVAIKCPRQFGHTTAAVNLMLKYPNSILIVPQQAMIKQYQSALPQQTINDRVFGGVIPQSLNNFGRLKGISSIDLVIFDPASSFGKAKSQTMADPLHLIKTEIMMVTNVKLFVELG